MNIISIGAGNIASHLVPALHNIGCNISQVYSRDIKNANSLARKVEAKAIADLQAVSDKADLYLIMVKDDVIREVSAQLPKLNSKQYLAHTSGATPTTFLTKRAENYGSFYPLQSFKKKKAVDIAALPFLIHGNNPKTLRKFRMLARQLSSNVSEANDLERMKYHLAAVILNNFTNHLACLTANFLKENKLKPKVLSPIMETTFASILLQNPCSIQTGPAARNDIKVEKEHLKIIKSDAYLSSIYKAMSQSIKNSSKPKPRKKK